MEWTLGAALMAVAFPLFIVVAFYCYCGKVPKPTNSQNPPVGRPQRLKVTEPRQINTVDDDTPPPITNGKASPAASTKLGRSEKFEKIKLKSFEYGELATSTGGFSNFNLLGEGGFGQVYKGTFADGEVVAIKKLRYEVGEKEEEFEAEILTISRVHHKHLVKLVGYCVDEANRLLVYELLPNNSLRSHLHGEDKRIISWSNRIKIAIGSAKALEYLHQGCDPKIIHRDIKADNILLDNNFQPKIADFGLARDVSHSVSHITTGPKGTFGYLAPEYVKDRKLTDKSDVFSFGVVLLELITGKKSVFFQNNDQEPHNLAIWMIPHIRKALENGKYRDLIDPKLEKEHIDENELSRMIHCATACVYKPARDRPHMRQIVEALEGNLSLERIWVNSDNNFLYAGAPYGSISQGSQENDLSLLDDQL